MSQKIKTCQNFSVRSFEYGQKTMNKPHKHTDEIYDAYNILHVTQLYRRACLKFYQRYLHLSMPLETSTSTRETRQTNNNAISVSMVKKN